MANGRHIRRPEQTQTAKRKKRRTKRKAGRTLFTLAWVVAIVAVCTVVLLYSPSISGSLSLPFFATPTATPEPTPTPQPTPLVQTVTFSASGDNLIHSPIYRQAAEDATGDADYDFAACYAHVADFFAGYDVNWINQESLVNDELEPSTYPTFSTPGECAWALYDIGFRVFSLSNNHSYDKGAAGIAATRRFWASMTEDVVTSGLWAGQADYTRIPTQQINGITIAYLSYTEHTNGIPTPSSAEANVIYTSETEVIQQQVQLARQQADVVVVSIHAGVENSHTITDAQRTLAQNLADWGADLIIGTHPHVLQDAEWLTAADGRSAFVVYSLGNFLSTQQQQDNLVGATLTLTMEKTTQPDGSVSVALIDPKLHPTVTHYESGIRHATVYWYKDYTPELAAAHGTHARGNSFTYDRILEIIQQNISPAFLALDE